MRDFRYAQLRLSLGPRLAAAGIGALAAALLMSSATIAAGSTTSDSVRTGVVPPPAHIRMGLAVWNTGTRVSGAWTGCAVKIRWVAPATGNPTDYQVRRNGIVIAAHLTTFHYVDSSAPCDRWLVYRVVGKDADGDTVAASLRKAIAVPHPIFRARAYCFEHHVKVVWARPVIVKDGHLVDPAAYKVIRSPDRRFGDGDDTVVATGLHRRWFLDEHTRCAISLRWWLRHHNRVPALWYKVVAYDTEGHPLAVSIIAPVAPAWVKPAVAPKPATAG